MHNQPSPLKIQREKGRQLTVSQPSLTSPPQDQLQKYIYLTTALLKDLIEEVNDDQQTYYHHGCQHSDVNSSFESIQSAVDATTSTAFDSRQLRNVDLQTYIYSIHSKTKFEPECLIIALIYIDRYNLQSKDFTLSWKTIHKLLLACLLLATKYHDQVYYDNKAFENGGGVNNAKLFQLEMLVFETLGFDLFVEQDYFFEFLSSIRSVYLEKEQANEEAEQQEQQEKVATENSAEPNNDIMEQSVEVIKEHLNSNQN